MSAPPEGTQRGASGVKTTPLTVILTVSLAAVVFWLWVCWCLFPLSVWNDVRLAPSLALARGEGFYPPQASGAVTTWIYGPLPVALWSPAALAGTAAGALLIAGTINIGFTILALAATFALWPAPLDRRTRLAACLFCVVIWPFAAFQYLQADNVAIALGLLGNLFLVRATRPLHLWAAALFAAAAVLCKQTSIGIGAAQILWLWIVRGPRESCVHAGRCVTAGLAAAGALLGPLDRGGAWFNMVTVPGGLPWAPDPVGRVRDMSPELLVHLVTPALILVLGRRALFRRDGPLLLPTLAFLCTLPPGLAAFFKFGGTLNSLQGFTLWCPAALLWLTGLARARGARPAALATCAAAGLAALLVVVRVVRMDTVPLRPVTDHYTQAAHLASEFPGQVWFPWNPLVTIYSEGRFYHVEDGMTMRFLARRALTVGHAREGLPPRMAVIALPRGGTDWGIALSLRPPGAQVQDFGQWTLHSWTPQAGAAP